jgi:hypothetical protein
MRCDGNLLSHSRGQVDVPYQWLRFFLHDDAKLAHIAEVRAAPPSTVPCPPAPERESRARARAQEYSKGRLLTSQVKDILVETLVPIVEGLQKASRARGWLGADVLCRGSRHERRPRTKWSACS